ncbi:MAG: nitrite/sulfite reductase [Myxococcota bacterium]|nr:nitrite/sulfite reductase [Myxococcota bacterium]
MTSKKSWKMRLNEKIPEDWGEDIDVFERQMVLRKEGKLSEKVFAETRLRKGVYGQRFDNGKRHDGIRTQNFNFPNQDLMKGPNTYWDAPGMIRLKIPYGAMTVEQLEVLADLSEEYSDGITHITTRQDIQFHFLHIDDAPDLMRRLAAVGITTKEACGNVVRNTTACPFAGVCRGEAFDVTPYAHGLSFFLMGHPDTQDFGRKVKIAFSGCTTNPCGLTSFHDIGAIAKTRRNDDGTMERGFELYVGGGLGSVPSKAKLFDEFLPEGELLPISQAICRVFGQLGEKNNRTRARMKFLVNSLGIEEFKRLVLVEREKLKEDKEWTSFLGHLDSTQIGATREGTELDRRFLNPVVQEWIDTNVRAQRQANYSTVNIACPLGDLSASQMRGLADLARDYVGDNIRASVEQNLILRWVSDGDLPDIHARLVALKLADAVAGTIVDITSCPGTDTCKLGHSASRGLASVLREQLAVVNTQLDEAVKELRIKVSGCFNSCGQHHVADIGFYGVGRKVKGYMVPHFQVVVGGEWKNNAGSFGLAIGAVPSKNIPKTVEVMTSHFVEDRKPGESFKALIGRLGKSEVKQWLKELQKVPAHAEDPSFYSDWGDPREYTTGDLGVGECAGEVVSFTEFGLSDSEREVFDAQLLLESGEISKASSAALEAMLTAARALVRIEYPDVGDAPVEVMGEFRSRYHETRKFHDPYAGAKFVNFLFRQFEDEDFSEDFETAQHRIEEAQLFIEAAYSCYARLGAGAQ